jgi:hypothetical protein
MGCNWADKCATSRVNQLKTTNFPNIHKITNPFPLNIYGNLNGENPKAGAPKTKSFLPKPMSEKIKGRPLATLLKLLWSHIN